MSLSLSISVLALEQRGRLLPVSPPSGDGLTFFVHGEFKAPFVTGQSLATKRTNTIYVTYVYRSPGAKMLSTPDLRKEIADSRLY